ncbi:MAG: RnfH family protein [Woeseiaceae bacterium]|jgi:putative ubiquitin-RnfH superfamily antitoxin RatB of RatAB toxin-antitoxin module
MADSITVEVVFALPERQKLVTVTLDQAASVADALEASGIYDEFPETDFAAMQTGVWGRLAGLDESLADGDRIEIYRPLERDPREARRELAKAQSLGSSS